MRPDDDYGPAIDTGIRSSDIGSFMPEGTYRPVPIVWVASAFILQGFCLTILFLALLNKAAIFTVGGSAILSLYFGHRAFARGLAEAARGWQIFLIGLLSFNWLLVSFASFTSR